MNKVKLKYDGDCYEAAANLIVSVASDNVPLVLCHGMVDGQGPASGLRFGHAWCECNDVVFDYSNGKKCVAHCDLYYRVGHINPAEVKRYTYAEARHLLLATKHYGPWPESEIQQLKKKSNGKPPNTNTTATASVS